MMELKEIEQKYGGCWVKRKDKKDSIIYLEGVDVDNGTITYRDESSKAHKVDYEVLEDLLDFSLPKTGYVNIDNVAFPHFLMRKGAKQFKRGLHPDNFSLLGLPHLILSRYSARNPQLIMKKKGELLKKPLSFSYASQMKDMFFRKFPSLPEAVELITGGLIGKALNERWALSSSITDEYEIDVYRELFKVGRVDVKRKIVYVYSIFYQEMFDYINRNKYNWSVKLED